MTQVPSYTVGNGPGSTVRTGFNSVLAALRDQNAGVTAPPSPVAFMLWLDQSVTPRVLRIRNEANSAWLPLEDVIGMTTTGLALANAVSAAAALAALGVSAPAAQIDRVASLATPRPSHFLAGDPSWNRAIGAADVADSRFWPATSTNNGVTFTRSATGVDTATGEAWVEYTLSGSATAVSTAFSFGYSLAQTSSLHAGAPTQVKTVSARLSASNVTGARVSVVEGSAQTLSTNVNASTLTLVSASRTLTTSDNVRCGLVMGVSAIGPVSGVIRIQGLQLEDGPARTNGRYAHLSPEQALQALGWARPPVSQAFSAALINFQDYPITQRRYVLGLRGVGFGAADGALIRMLTPAGQITSQYRADSGNRLSTVYAENGFPVLYPSTSFFLYGQIVIERISPTELCISGLMTDSQNPIVCTGTLQVPTGTIITGFSFQALTTPNGGTLIAS